MIKYSQFRTYCPTMHNVNCNKSTFFDRFDLIFVTFRTNAMRKAAVSQLFNLITLIKPLIF